MRRALRGPESAGRRVGAPTTAVSALGAPRRAEGPEQTFSCDCPSHSPELVAAYDGQLIVVRRIGEPFPLIERADPKIQMTTEFLAWIDTRRSESRPCLLRITATNLTVIYRIDHHDIVRGLYLASWLD